jgi:hypothetical protein
LAAADVGQQRTAEMRPDSRRGLRGDLWRVARLLARRGQGHAATQGDLRTAILAARGAAAGAVRLAGAGLFKASYRGLLAMCIASVGQNGTNPWFWTLPSTHMTDTAAAASIPAINTVGNLGSFMGPHVVGWIKDTTQSLDGVGDTCEARPMD